MRRGGGEAVMWEGEAVRRREGGEDTKCRLLKALFNTLLTEIT